MLTGASTIMGAMSFRHLATAVVSVSLATMSGCGSNSETGFCDSATAVLEAPHPPDGGDLGARLEAVRLDGLSDSEAASWRAAVENVTRQVHLFNSSASSDGWSTSIAASAASRICGSQIDSFSVVP
jgi:hypothetical protein